MYATSTLELCIMSSLTLRNRSHHLHHEATEHTLDMKHKAAYPPRLVRMQGLDLHDASSCTSCS